MSNPSFNCCLFLLLVCGLQICFSSKVLTRDQVHQLHQARWCDESHLIHHVLALGKLQHCHNHSHEEKDNRLEFIKKHEIKVAAYKGFLELQHDCWAEISEGIAKLKNSYSSFIINILRDVMKLRLKVVVVQQHRPSSRKINNSFPLVSQELVRVVASGEADLGLCHLSVTSSRINQIDFLHPTFTARRALIFVSSRLSINEDVFVLTFSGTLWICFFLAIILLVICFRFSTWLHSQVRPDHEPWSWIEVMLWAIAAVCQQSYSRHPKGISCRTTFMIGYLITYLLYTGFAAGVTSLLAVQGSGLKLSLDDVINMKLTLVTTAHTTHHPLIEDPDATEKKNKQTKKLTTAQVLSSNEELFKKLHEENVVGFGSIVTLENYLRRIEPRNRQQDYTISPLLNSRTQEGLIIRKNSPYKEYFNLWLLKMQESGLLALGKARYLNVAQDNCCDAPGWSSAGLDNVLSAILILNAGYFFSVLILFVEIAWMRKQTKTKWETQTKNDVLKHYKLYHSTPTSTVS